MQIEDNEEYVPKKNRNKTITIVSILIAVTLIVVIAIVILIMVTYKKQLTATVDGKKVEFAENTFLFMEGTSGVYISIQDIAPLVGYEAHNGEYKINSEDISKMYVEAKDGTETTSFFLNSTQISKVPPDSDEDYENIQISEPVISVNGKLYINSEGFMEGFNSVISYNQEENLIIIQTLPYLVEYYKNNITKFGYDALSEDFVNQKALIYGMIVASKESTGKYGVVNIRTNKEVISPRYNNIQFIEGSREFIITNSSEKVGIAYGSGETKINVLYDEIKVLDSKLGYYLVKSNSKYGVINSNEELVIHIEYDDIGVELADFPADHIKSQYILCDTLIPVCLNGKWGFFDKEGNKIIEPEYNGIGCVSTELTDKAVNNAMVIGDSGVVVVYKSEGEGEDIKLTFGGISTKGDLLMPVMFNNVYSITSGGETTYYMEYNNVTYKALDMINAMKAKLGYEVEEETPKETPEETTQPENTEAPEPTASPEQTPNIEDVII